MKKFMLLYMAPVTAEEQMAIKMDPEEGKKVMDAWTAWYDKCGSAMVDPGTPLGNGKTYATESVGARTSQVAGYSIVQADNLDVVMQMLEGHPHLMMPGFSIEVLESMPIQM